MAVPTILNLPKHWRGHLAKVDGHWTVIGEAAEAPQEAEDTPSGGRALTRLKGDTRWQYQIS